MNVCLEILKVFFAITLNSSCCLCTQIQLFSFLLFYNTRCQWKSSRPTWFHRYAELADSCSKM